MANGVFDTNTNNSNEGPELDVTNITAETLVGEGQKYSSVDELAKAYANADAYIARVKAERAQEQAELKVLRDIAQARSNSAEPVENNSHINQTPRHENPPVDEGRQKNDETDLAALVRAEIEKTTEASRFSGNVDTVAKRLTEQFGTAYKANEFIKTKAAELGVTVDWLMDIAGRSPQALFRTVGLDSTQSRASPNAGTDANVNTAAFGNSAAKRNFRYYEDIRKTDPKSYHSQAIQRQMFKDRQDLGSAFY